MITTTMAHSIDDSDSPSDGNPKYEQLYHATGSQVDVGGANDLITVEKKGTVDKEDKELMEARDALALCLGDHPDRADLCKDLSLLLWKRYNASSNVAYLDESISLDREALSLRPEAHPDRAAFCRSLGVSL
jgi:hypothetical protein